MSAFLSLENLLDSHGISYAREDIAEQCILVDILTGIISPLDDGDLVISTYALNKVASLYGLTLSGAKLVWNDLIQLHEASPLTKVIAHINGNHYVIITDIAQDTITYIDPGIGDDKKNESLTITKEGFLRAWKGFVTTEQNVLSAVIPIPSATLGINSIGESRFLSVQETQSIRGAFWGSLLGLIGSILVWTPLNPLGIALTGISAIVSGIEGDWISAISAIVTLGVAPNGLGGFFKDAFHGITQALGGLGQIFNNVAGFIGNVYSGVTGVLGNLSGGLGGFLRGALGVSSKLAADIASTAVSIGVNFGVSKGFEAIGVDPQIAGFLGSLSAGAIVGGMKSIDSKVANVAVAQTKNIQSSVQQVITLSQVGRLGLELGLDSSFTNILGLSLAAIQGNIITNPGTSLEKAFSAIKPQFFSSLAQYGITTLGNELGVDSRISTLAGIPVTSTLSGIFQGGNISKNIIDNIQQGLVRGVTSVAIEGALQTADIDAFTGSLITLTGAGAIEGILEGQGLFKGVFDAYFNATTGLLSLGGLGSTTYDQALYLSKAIDFSNIIREKGIASALETYATGIFHGQTVESIWKVGGIYDLLTHNAEIVTNDEGKTVKRLYFDKNNKSQSEYIDISLSDDQLVGYKEIELGRVIITDCVYEIGPDGRVVAKDERRKIINTDGTTDIYTVKDHYLVSLKRFGKDGNLKEEIIPENLDGVHLNDQGEVTDGLRINFKEKVQTTYRSGNVVKMDLERRYLPSDQERQYLLDMGYTDQQIGQLNEKYTYDATGAQRKVHSTIYNSDGSLIQVKGTTGNQWLNSVSDNAGAVWQLAVQIVADSKAATYVTLDRDKGVANIDMELTYPAQPNPNKRLLFQAMDIAEYLARSNANWHTEVMHALPNVGAIIANKDANFLYMAGVNSNGLSLDNLYQLKLSLDTTKTVVVGHSAGTELAIRSSFIQKADKYIIASPRMSPDTFVEIMKESGIRPDQVIIATTEGDFYNWGPSYDRSKYGWTDIHIVSGPGVSNTPILGTFSSHGVPIDGWLSGSEYTVSVNGGEARKSILSSIYKDEVSKQ